MQCALDTVCVFPIRYGMVMDLIGARNYAIYGVTAKSAYMFWARLHPPIHQVKVMAVFIDETATALPPILNPFARLGLERPAKFLAPCHVRRANRARIHQLFELPKKR